MDPRSYPSAHIKQAPLSTLSTRPAGGSRSRPSSAPLKRSSRKGGDHSRSQLVSLVYFGPSTRLIPGCSIRKADEGKKSSKQTTASWYPTAEVLKDQAQTRAFNKELDQKLLDSLPGAIEGTRQAIYSDVTLMQSNNYESNLNLPGPPLLSQDMRNKSTL